MTPTDICTIMLYQDIADWQQYYVIAKNKVNIWSRDENTVQVIDKDEWEKANKPAR